MKYWYLSDLHLGHGNIIKYCSRPFKDVDQMNTVLIDNCNSRIKDGDIVYHIGDFCFKNSPGGKDGEGEIFSARSWEKRLNGKWIHIKGNHDCFSMDTRVLTANGYKTYSEIKVGDMVPTVNLNTKCVEYKPVNDIIINNVDYAYKFKCRSSEGIFSHNHRHLYSFGTAKNLPIRINTSMDIWKHKSPIKMLAAFQSGNTEIPISDVWLKLLAWILTDGGIEKKQGRVTIYQSKPKYVKEIRKILDSLHIEYIETARQRNTKIICGKKLVSKPMVAHEFKMSADSSRNVLNMLMLKKDKHLPGWVNKISDRQCELFITEMGKGDGSPDSNTPTIVIWGQKESLETIMGLCVTHNLKSNLIEDCRGSYYLTVSQRKHHRETEFKYKTIYPSKRNIELYDGKMWCINVDNHVIFTELNGKTLITGNSNNSCKTNIESMIVEAGGNRINLTHKPEYADPDYRINLVGHVHEKWKFKDYGSSTMINMSVDVWGFKPVHINEIMVEYHRWKNKVIDEMGKPVKK